MKTLTLPKGLPPLPPVPKGYDRIELKGYGWSCEDKKLSYACTFIHSESWSSFCPPSSANGVKSLYYILAVKDKKPAKKKVLVNKKGWVDYAKQKPKKSDYPIKISDANGINTDGQSYTSCTDPKFLSHWEESTITHWMHDDTPLPPLAVTPDPFEIWWASQSNKRNKSICKAAWDAAIKEGK